MPAVMTMLADHAARQLLDFSQKLDINLLDNVVNCLYHGVGPQQRMAQEVLTHLKEHPDAWTRVDTILEFSQNMNTKVIFHALWWSGWSFSPSCLRGFLKVLVAPFAFYVFVDLVFCLFVCLFVCFWACCTCALNPLY
uniref:Exportin 1 n=1 Tax=Electrophorus electricus TaxID=8005 RepID=A0A4W4ED78_ELEEL